MAPRKPRAQGRLQRKIAEKSLEANAAARERARQKITANPGAPAELRMGAELGDEWVDVLLDDEEPELAEVPVSIREALQGPHPESATRAARGHQDSVDVTIPSRVTAEDLNKYLELLFGDTFEPLPETAKGKVTLTCARKTAGTVRKGVVIRGEEIKAQAKQGRDAGSGEDDDEGAGGRWDERHASKGTGKERRRSRG